MRPSLLLLLAGLASACSSSASTSGLDATKTLDTLDASERGRFCDWAADQFGGYGKERNCSRISHYAPTSRAECLPSAIESPCAATVGDFEAFFRTYASCGEQDDAFKDAATALLACSDFGAPADLDGGADAAADTRP